MTITGIKIIRASAAALSCASLQRVNLYFFAYLYAWRVLGNLPAFYAFNYAQGQFGEGCLHVVVLLGAHLHPLQTVALRKALAFLTAHFSLCFQIGLIADYQQLQLVAAVVADLFYPILQMLECPPSQYLLFYLVMSYIKKAPMALRQQDRVMDLKFYCPAVSHTWNLIVLPFISTILEANYTPIVTSWLSLMVCSVNCSTTDDLPTPISWKGTCIADNYKFEQIVILVGHGWLKLCLIQYFYKSAVLKHTTPTSVNRTMILSNCFSVKLQQKYRKILYLYAACNQTFVFLALIADRQDGVVHVDREGKELFRHLFKIPMEAMAMLSDREVIFAETRRNRIACLDLQTHEFSYFPHQFMNEESDQSELFTFSQTKYLCLEQKGRYNDNRYKLTYFHYPLQLVDKRTRTVAVYDAKDDEWTYEHMTKKANNYSMMCWYKSRHDDYFEFKLYELQGNRGQYTNYKINNSIAADTHTVKMEVAIFNAWELKKDHFLFVCLTNNTEGKKSGGTVINNNYVIDFKNKQIKESLFTFGPFQNTLIDYYSFGAYSMFRTYKFQDGKPVPSPTYYVDNQSERVIAEQSWECSSLYKYQFPGYGSGYLCEGLYENTDVDSFKVNLKRLVPLKETYIHLMSEQHPEMQQEFISATLEVLGLL